MTSSVPSAGRLLRAAGAAIAAAAALTACGSAGHSPASAPGAAPAGAGAATAATSSAPSAPSAAACANATLRPSLRVAGAAAGTAYYLLRLTNISGHSCSLFGYPGVSFVSGVPGHQIGRAAARNPLYSPVRVVLAAQATAHALLGVADAGNYPAARCRPATARALRVFPPGLTAAVEVWRSFPACAAHVPVLSVTTVRPGKGGRGG